MEALVWLLILVGLIVIEIITLGLTTIWFAGGALAAFIASLCGTGMGVQIVLFLVVSFVLLLFTRPTAVRLLSKDQTKTNVEGLIGKQAVVIETIDNLKEQGKVHYTGIEWTARASDPLIVIEKEQIVNIIGIEGVKLIVECKGGNEDAR